MVNVWIPPEAWSPESYVEAKQLFPEALILWVNPSGNWERMPQP